MGFTHYHRAKRKPNRNFDLTRARREADYPRQIKIKLQAPTFKLQRSFKSQNFSAIKRAGLELCRIEVSLELGAWNLELPRRERGVGRLLQLRLGLFGHIDLGGADVLDLHRHRAAEVAVFAVEIDFSARGQFVFREHAVLE